MNPNLPDIITDYCIIVIDEIDKIIRKANKNVFSKEDLEDSKESLKTAKNVIENLEKKLA